MTGALGLLSIKSITYLTFTVFLIAAAGYLLGRVTIKGINLGTAGVFIAALLYGCFFYSSLEANLVVGDVTFAKEALKIVENVGLVLFVSSVGFIAGPSFFRNLKKNYKSYVSLGLIIILAAVLVTIAVIFIGERFSTEDHESFKALVAGLLSGALTSTPAFSAAKESVGAAHEDLVAVGNGIAYLFGVIGVVLFVQLVPKIMKADMVVERQKIMADQSDEKKDDSDLIKLDDFGLCAFSVAAILGILVGCIGYKGFSLTVTGGCLLVTLVFGHFGKIGRVSIMPSVTSLKVFRELGLMLFLIGAGVAGGASFIRYFRPIYVIYGAIITILPMIIGFIFSKYVMKMPLLNSLGSLTGGMTSTPALGTLISTAGTEAVASAYAATYPIALLSIVIATKLMIQLL